MANVEFTLEELEDLARKLQTLQPILSEEECVLLLAILRVVIDLTIGCRLATLTDLKQQLGNSYTPGGDIDSLTIGESTFYKICPPSRSSKSPGTTNNPNAGFASGGIIP